MDSIRNLITAQEWANLTESTQYAVNELSLGDSTKKFWSSHDLVFTHFRTLNRAAAELNPLWNKIGRAPLTHSILLAAAAMKLATPPGEEQIDRIAMRMTSVFGGQLELGIDRTPEFLLHDFLTSTTPEGVGPPDDTPIKFFNRMISWNFGVLLSFCKGTFQKGSWVYGFPREVDETQFVQGILNRFLGRTHRCNCFLRCSGAEFARNIEKDKTDERGLAGNALRRFAFCKARHRITAWLPKELSFPKFVYRAVVGSDYSFQPGNLTQSMAWNVLRDHVETEHEPLEWAALIVDDVLQRACPNCSQLTTQTRCPSAACNQEEIRGDQLVMSRRNYIAIFPRNIHAKAIEPKPGREHRRDIMGNSQYAEQDYRMDENLLLTRELDGGFVMVETRQCKLCKQEFLAYPRLGGFSDQLGLPDFGCIGEDGKADIAKAHQWPQRPSHRLMLITSPTSYRRAILHRAAFLTRTTCKVRSAVKLCDAFQRALEQRACEMTDPLICKHGRHLVKELALETAKLVSGTNASDSVINDRITLFEDIVWPGIVNSMRDIEEYRIY